MLQKSSLDQDQYSQGNQATDAHPLCLEPPAATSSCLFSVMISVLKHLLRREKKWAKQMGWMEKTEHFSQQSNKGEGWKYHTWIGRRHRALLGCHAHIPLCLGYPLLWCLNLSSNSPLLSPITSYFSYLLSVSSHCSNKPVYSPRVCQGPVSIVVSLRVLQVAFATCRWKSWGGDPVTQLRIKRYSKLFCPVNAPPVVPF